MTKQRKNIDWTVAFELAARAGSHELIRALQAAVEHERTAFTEEYDAIVARQRSEYEALLAHQRDGYEAIIAAERAKLEQQFAALERKLLTKVENEFAVEYAALRRELAAAHAELARLRPSPAPQPAH